MSGRPIRKQSSNFVWRFRPICPQTGFETNEWDSSGQSAFAEDYGVLETITKIEPGGERLPDGKTTITEEPPIVENVDG